MGLPPILAHAKGVHPPGTDASPCTGWHSHRFGLAAALWGHGSNRSCGRRQPAHRGAPAGPHNGHHSGSGCRPLDRFSSADHFIPGRHRLTLVRHRSGIHRSRARRPCSPVLLFSPGHHAGALERHPSTQSRLYYTKRCYFASGTNSHCSLKAGRKEGDGPFERTAGPEAATDPGHSRRPVPVNGRRRVERPGRNGPRCSRTSSPGQASC
jgi:hypothetical protein